MAQYVNLQLVTNENGSYSIQDISQTPQVELFPLQGQKIILIDENNTQDKQEWSNTQENNESFQIVVKKEPQPARKVVSNIVRSPQSSQIVTQGGSGKKPARAITLVKRHSTGTQPVGILKNTLQGQKSLPAGSGNMKRNFGANNSNINLPERSRASTIGTGVQQLVTPPRAPQPRPPIHLGPSPRNVLPSPRDAPEPPCPEFDTLSERIRQVTARQRAPQIDRSATKLQPIATVSPMPIVTVQGPAQRQKAMGDHRVQIANFTEDTAMTMDVDSGISETPMEVDSTAEQSNQVDSSVNCDLEENSSESVAYLQQEIKDPNTAIVQDQITGNEAKMLVILENGEQRLITFEVPTEECTVQDLLEQANIGTTQEPHVSLVSDPALGINYIVDTTVRPSMYDDELSTSGDSIGTVSSTVEQKSPVKNNVTQPVKPAPPTSPRTPRYIKGMLAVCTFCGGNAPDFNYCMRCKRKLPDNVKALPISSTSSTAAKKQTGVPPETFYKRADPQSQKERETVARRGRGGRGRAPVARTRQIKEPECLTISSDEEDDNRKKRLEDGKESSNLVNSNNDESETILEKEPVITNDPNTSVRIHTLTNMRNPQDKGISPTDSPDSAVISTLLTCRTVRIGSYKYVPNEKISISSNGLRLEVPTLEDDKSTVIVDIRIIDMVKVLIHFAKSMPVLFFYTNPETGLRIRDILGMQDPKGPYFDPASKDQTHKRITLLPEKITEESKAAIKEILKSKFEELNTKEANDILVKASPKVKTLTASPAKRSTPAASANSNSNGVIQTITVYPPPPAKGGIAINTEDFTCLAEDQFLNDVIIDFYLKYLSLEVLSKEDNDRTHMFSSYFYKRLTSPHAQANENTDNLSPAAKRHARVQKWTKNVNIFEKDFVVIPINEHAHWFLAIICFPGLVGTVLPQVETKSDVAKLLEKKKKDSQLPSLVIGNTTITPINTITIDTTAEDSERDEAEGDEEEMETDSEDEDESNAKPASQPAIAAPIIQQMSISEVIKVPCILIFDSLAGASRARVVATLRDYLSCEYVAKMGKEKIFSKDTIKGHCPKVPQQSNFTDCGLYVLQYVESFFEAPLRDYSLPIKTLKTWFEEIVVTRKREELAKLLTQLVEKTKGNKTINLPVLTFPTQDGKLKQKPETEKVSVKVENESKKTPVESQDSKSSNTVSAASETVTSSKDDPVSKDGPSQVTTSAQTLNQITLPTTQVEITAIQKDAVSTTVARTPAETRTLLKNARIPRLQKAPQPREDEQAAKKHKGDSFDTCK
ncbi:hypothetical protein QAD02_010669 [Eretmocerus hayati]|uniref:Uncharacterized protein n=1 Tax=Eretmocerus hayati TaxID=131215 RepID=A0ACC2NVJ6_9HYME|nr:hypothetical protein QAD02_010669 [Eretmocerus hayati]